MRSARKDRVDVILLVVISVTLSVLTLGTGSALAKNSFTANLSGKQEVPPVETDASGKAVFKLSKDEKKLHYKVTLENIENVTMAHIHQAPSGKNGPVDVWLYPKTKSPKLKPGKFNGVLAEGDITSSDLTGPLAGKSLKDLAKEMKEGKTYVNVHTKQYPEGELRGQIQ